jgi:hypothetical protein
VAAREQEGAHLRVALEHADHLARALHHGQSCIQP